MYKSEQFGNRSSFWYRILNPPCTMPQMRGSLMGRLWAAEGDGSSPDTPG